MRRGLAGAIGIALLLAVPTGAKAANHLIKVSEVSAGSGADASYVELKMFGDGENFILNKTITVYSATGAAERTFSFPANAASGQNQRTILIADTNGPVGADFTWSGLDLGQNLTAGAVCYQGDGAATDCVAWGLGFTGEAALPSPDAGAVGLDIPTTNSLSRVEFRGCNTLLDSADDTNSSANDFALTQQTPQPNATAPTGSPCPETEITKAPKAKSTDRTPAFSFEGTPPPVLFVCSLDGAEFEDCASPFKPGKLKRGKHTFEVAAIEDGGDASEDGTPDKHSWKIVRKR